MWLSACRPRTLPLTLSPLLVGAALCWQAGQWAWEWAVLMGCTAVLLQIGANLANDYFDGVNGKDSPHRVGPTRLTGSGLVKPGHVKGAMWGVLGAAVCLGIPIMIRGGWPIVLVGIASVWAAWGYSGGKRPYGYWGGADGIVWLFFGPVACQGMVWVMTHRLIMDAWVLGAAQGLVATAVLVVNYIRDETEDRQTGKRTLVVRFGSRWGYWQY
ncbi:1,4-dihydroxy-2-naphthoate octaprenyltransferase, partial [bacterium]|nr:1,4-dihydroxy-2-naphthoate octaprenyltransferase [bacterium]